MMMMMMNAKYCLYLYIKYKGLVVFYGISTILGYLLQNSLYIYIYICTKHIEFPKTGFYGISNIAGYSMPIPPYTYIFNIYMIWFR